MACPGGGVERILTHHRLRVWICAMAEKDIRDFRVAQSRDIDQSRIPEFVHGVHVGPTNRQKANSVDEPFDREKMKRGLVMDPSGIQQFRTLPQHSVGFGRMFNDSVQELANEFVRQVHCERQSSSPSRWQGCD